eukprot:m51a1_g6299 hypothetical protein (373) ;mRNA; r:290162-291687
MSATPTRRSTRTRTAKRPPPDEVSDYEPSGDGESDADYVPGTAAAAAATAAAAAATATAAAASDYDDDDDDEEAPRRPRAKRSRAAAPQAPSAGGGLQSIAPAAAAPSAASGASARARETPRAQGARGGGRSSAARQKGLTAAQLRKRLGALSKEQLVDIACTIAGETGYDMQKVLGSDAGKPDLAAMDKEIGVALRRFNASFPHARFGSNVDTYAYKRVAGNLRQFKQVLVQHLADVVNSADWNSVADFVEGIALKYVEDVPLFDDPKHNAARNSIVAKLAVALRRASKSLAQERRDRLAAAVARSSFAAELGPAVQGQGAAPRKSRSSSSGAGMSAPVDELPADMEVTQDVVDLASDDGGDEEGDENGTE